MHFDHRKASWMVADVPVSVLTTTKYVGDLKSFGECVLTIAKRVGGLQKFGECVLTNAKRV